MYSVDFGVECYQFLIINACKPERIISFASFLATIQSIWNEIALLDEKSGDDQSN